MKKLVAAVCGAALMSVSGLALAQGTTGSTSSSANKPMTGSTAGKSMEFKAMDANNDGWVTRDEYLAFYGSRYDTMKHNDKGYVSWSDMQASDGRFFSNNPTANTPPPKGGAGAPKATGGGSN